MRSKRHRLLFNSHGRLGVIDLVGAAGTTGQDDAASAVGLDNAAGAAGTRVWYPRLDVPGMASWGWGPVFGDQRRVIVSSYEPGKAWEGNVRVHLWIYDLEEDRLLEEIALRNRPAPFMGCTHILPGEDRLVMNPIIDGKQRIWTMDVDGSDPREITGAEEGFVYCVHSQDFR